MIFGVFKFIAVDSGGFAILKVVIAIVVVHARERKEKKLFVFLRSV